MPAAFDLLCRMLRRALEAEEGVAGDAVPLGTVAPRDLAGVDPATLLADIRRQRVEDVLLTHAEMLELPDEPRATPGDRRAGNARPRILLQALESARATTLLASAGIDALVVKGQALAVDVGAGGCARAG